MKTHRKALSIFVAATLTLSGCVSVDHRFDITISRPTQTIYFTTIQWQTNIEWRDDKDWEKKAEEMARAAIKAEFLRLRLPCDAIVFEHATRYIGDWVSVRATVGSVSEEELRRAEAEFFKTHMTGRPLPTPFHRGRGEFPKKVPNQASQRNAMARPISVFESRSSRG